LHITCDEGFIAAKINLRNVEAAEKETEKKRWVEHNARHEVPITILDCLEN
jgi:hypothetical protein